jgi:hypothetical protein
MSAHPRNFRLSLIGPWTLTVGEDGAATYVDGWRPANVDEPTRKVEVVPADQLTGAVEALHRAHAALDAEHGHTAETWADRERWPAPTGGALGE